MYLFICRKEMNTEKQLSRFMVIIVVGMMSTFTTNSCSLRLIRYTVHYNECQPRNVIAFSCTGACLSSSRPSPVMSSVLEQSCQCCITTYSINRNVSLRCPAVGEGTGFRTVLVPVRLPRRCSCKACLAS